MLRGYYRRASKTMALYFNADELPSPRGEYVAWFDGMGTGQALGTSLPTAANFVMKLHLAFARVPAPQNVHLYPVMDGLYITSPSRNTFQRYLRAACLHLASEFLTQHGVLKRFLVRCGIAYGASVHGDDVPDSAFRNDEGERKFSKDVCERMKLTRSSILLNSAMLPAYNAESKAPPFGFYVDDTALSVPQVGNEAYGGFPGRYWRWWFGDEAAEETAKRLAQGIIDYLKVASTMTRELSYPTNRVQEHLARTREYFAALLQSTNRDSPPITPQAAIVPKAS